MARDKIKTEARKLQTITGWRYTFCRHLVDRLGSETIAEELRLSSDSYEQIGERLNQRARSVKSSTP
jgi:hypothetical protein